MGVKVENFRDRLRLRWSHEGEHYYLPGWKDTDLGRSLAQRRASLIDTDIAMGNFDPTLDRYRSDAKERKASGVSAAKLFEQFTAHKRKGDITDRTAVKYKSLAGKVAAFFGEQNAVIEDDHADRFREVLAETLAPDTQRAYLFLMQAAWDWGIKRKLVTVNPWGEVLGRVKVPPKQPPTAFSKEEITAIVNGFRDSQYYSHYTDLVTFLFGVGCRTGEAIGLQWKHLSEDCGSVWILASKTNQARTFRLTSHLQTMLLKRRTEGWGPDDLVFPAVQGGAIDGHNFRNRAWGTVLKDAGVPYRTPYTTRHTFISHSLRVQRDEDVARMAGHKVETMRKHYAADVSGGLQCPDIFA
jgi:integrase